MYLIYGIQKSGLSIVNYFENKKIKFKIWDDNPIVRKAVKKNYNKDYFFNIKKDNLNDFEKIFKNSKSEKLDIINVINKYIAYMSLVFKKNLRRKYYHTNEQQMVFIMIVNF